MTEIIEDVKHLYHYENPPILRKYEVWFKISGIVGVICLIALIVCLSFLNI